MCIYPLLPFFINETNYLYIFYTISRSYIHWFFGFGHEAHPEEDDFNNALRNAIVFHRGVAADRYMTNGFTCRGNGKGERQWLMVGTAGLEQESRIYGHAVFIQSWEIKNGIWEWGYLNSRGRKWGLKPYKSSGTSGHGNSAHTMVQILLDCQLFKDMS